MDANKSKEKRTHELKVHFDVDREYDLARAAARNFVPMTPPDIFGWQKAAYEHGYAQALLDVQDGKVKL